MAFLHAQFVAVNLVQEEKRRRAIKDFRMLRRYLRDTQDPFSITNKKFVRNYRLRKENRHKLI